MSSIYDWSATASDNSNSDSAINWAENQAPGTVNNSARAMMGRLAELVGDIGGDLEAGGTANALTLTANSDFTAYADGRIIAFKASADNTAATTLSVNGIGAKAIRKMTSAGEAAVDAGDIINGYTYVVRYSETANSAAGAWLLDWAPKADTSAFVTLTGTQTLTNKTITLTDAALTITGSSDATKKLNFQIDGFTTATTRTITVPNADTTLVGTDTTQTLTNKTLTGAALNGTLGATTPSVVIGTTGSFSGNVVAAGNTLIGVTGVPGAMADLALGAIGTTGLFLYAPGGTITPGQVVSGSVLRYASTDADNSGVAPTGNWMCVGYSDGITSVTEYRRVS